MSKKIAVVGAGINGLLTAYLIRASYPGASICIFDIEKHPKDNPSHKGVTLGSRDARHITGSESIGFENSIHKDALRTTPRHRSPGWLLKEEDQLSPAELRWREEFEKTYTNSSSLNKLDFAHAKLNYRGLTAWYELASKYSFIKENFITTTGVEVYFENKTDFENDVEMESEFCRRYYPDGLIKSNKNTKFDNLYAQKLVVPGISMRTKSLTLKLIELLEQDQKVEFQWGEEINSAKELDAETVIWTVGVTHRQPVEYQEYDVQGIVGCWITVENNGYTNPFKIATPAPSAYINLTPDGDSLHVSGGFGWSGSRNEIAHLEAIARPVTEHFLLQAEKYLHNQVKEEDVEFCIRPSTPTGQPLLVTKSINGQKNIFITGSAKSGTTHAPILSEYVVKQISL